MTKKEKRDLRINQEKEYLLDPEYVAAKKKKRKKKLALTIVIELIAVAALIVAAFQIVRAVGKKSLTSKAEEAAPDLNLVRASETLTEEEETKWQEGWVKYNGSIYAYNEDIRTFLFMGIDKKSDVKEVEEGTKGGQADALFLAVMNPHDKTLKIVGINRNTMADVDIYNDSGAYVTTQKAQIAVQHGFGNGVEESCEYQKKAVSRLFYGLPIHGYAAINMSAISTINDAVGGVDVTVLDDLTKYDSSLKKDAKVHLMGEAAFWYVKVRDVNVFGSADMRLARQKQYLNAYVQAAKSAAKKDITVALDLYQAVVPQMVTDISADEVAYLAPILVDYSFDENSFYMMQGETVMGDEFEEFYPDEDALYEMILNIFYEPVEQ